MTKNSQYSEAEKHCSTKINVDIEGIRGLWSEATDKQRIEIIKSVIWTAPNMYSFYNKILNVINSDKFAETLD